MKKNLINSELRRSLKWITPCVGIHKKALFATLISVALLLTSCFKSEEKLPEMPPEEQFISIHFDVHEVYSFDLVTILGGLDYLTETSYTGTMGDSTIIANKQEDGNLAFKVPLFISSGNMDVVFQIGDIKAIGNLFLLSYSEVENPQTVIDEVTDFVNTVVAYLENEMNETGETLDTEELQLFTELTEEFNRLMSQFTEAEKIYLAQYWAAHPELLNWLTNDDNDPNSVQTKNIASILAKMKTAEGKFVRKVVACGILVGAVGVATFAPEATVSKAIAIVASSALIATLISARKELNALLGTKIFPQSVIPSIFDEKSATMKNYTQNQTEGYDYTFYWHMPVTFEFSINYRTLYAEDAGWAGAQNSVIGSIITNIFTFHEYWSKVDGVVSGIKSFFGFGGGLGQKPKKLDEVTTFQTGDIEKVEPYMADIGWFNRNIEPPFTVSPPFDWTYYLYDDGFSSQNTTGDWHNRDASGRLYFNLYFKNEGDDSMSGGHWVVSDEFTSKIIGQFVKINVPTVNNITTTSATLRGNIEFIYPYAEVVERGVYLSYQPTACGSGTGAYSYVYNDLWCNTNYSYGAYAILRHTVSDNIIERNTLASNTANNPYFQTLPCQD